MCLGRSAWGQLDAKRGALSPIAFMLVGVVALGGCLGDGIGSDPPPTQSPSPWPNTVSEAATACDRPLLSERVRAREIDVASDPNNPMHMAAVMMVPWPTQYSAAPYDAMGWTGLALSEDGGETWEYQALSGYPGDPKGATSPFAGAEFIGDAIVGFQPNGDLIVPLMLIYPPVWVTLAIAEFPWGSFEPRFVTTISRGAMGDGLETVPTSQPFWHNDYEKFYVDPATHEILIGWSIRWQQSEQAEAYFAKSQDGGRTWSDHVPISPISPHYLAGTEHQMGPWPVVTADGRLLVVWTETKSGRIFVSESSDHGASFEPRRLMSERTGVETVSLDIDLTGGPHHGNIYAVTTDRRNGDLDVYLHVSRDNGSTWNDATRVNADPVGNGAVQRMPELVWNPTVRSL